MQQYAKVIENSPKLSDAFYNIHDKLYNNDRHKTITTIFMHTVWNDFFSNNNNSQNSWVIRAADFLQFRKKNGMGRFANIKLAFGLEKFTTSEKCFDFVIDIQNKQLFREKCDTTYKDIKLLKDTNEILKYIVLSKAPTYYKNNPDKQLQAINRLKNKLN